MRAKHLFIAAAVILVLALVTLGLGWHGTANFTLASPLSSAAVEFCGSAHGGWAIGGMAGIVVAIILFIVGVVRAIKRAVAP